MHPALRYLLVAAGLMSLALGVVGLFLPVLPTTPFVLLAAACFMRGSDRLHGWLLSHPRFGPQIADYLAGRGVPAKTKAVAISALWLSVTASIVWFIPHLAADIAAGLIALAVTIYLLRLPTAPAD